MGVVSETHSLIVFMMASTDASTHQIEVNSEKLFYKVAVTIHQPTWVASCVYIVLFANNKRELQKSLDAYARYCTNWKLDIINVSTTKIVCFGRKRNSKFTISNEEIDIVDNFKYLGVNLSKNGRFLNAIKENITKATKGLHSLRASFRIIRLIAN